MSRRGRSVYTPIDRGYVYCSDAWDEIFHVDCTAGGAQRVFEDLCYLFMRAGWTVGERSFDTIFVRRDGKAWHITIRKSLKVEPRHSSPPNPLMAEPSRDTSVTNLWDRRPK